MKGSTIYLALLAATARVESWLTYTRDVTSRSTKSSRRHSLGRPHWWRTLLCEGTTLVVPRVKVKMGLGAMVGRSRWCATRLTTPRAYTLSMERQVHRSISPVTVWYSRCEKQEHPELREEVETIVMGTGLGRLLPYLV